jgi:glycosyltransferase involved in cell wall biosynthesis
LFARVARRADAYTFVSRWLRDEAASLAAVHEPEVAPMPVAVDRFRPPSPDAPRDGLLFVGRLNRQKGVADLLRAAAHQRRHVPVSIVGDGPDAPTLHHLAQTLGIADRIRWIRSVTPDELAELYRSAQALVVPSHGEGLGLVAVEAMLSETPVIAYASGGLVDVVQDGESGLLVAAGDHAALSAAMDRLCEDASLARALGSTARPRALATFGPDAVARRYRAVYDRAVSQRAARRSGAA